MDALLQDIRYGCRQLQRQRGSSLIAVLTLALGIGVTAAVFSVIDATLLRPLPYPNPGELVTVRPEETMPDGRVSRATASMEDMRIWQEADDVFSAVAGVGSAFRGRIVDGAEPSRIRVSHYTEDYLSMHGVAPLLGRGFSRDDTDAASPLVALLGYGFWRSHYGGREDIVGQSVRFDTEVATIIGVLPSWFDADTPVATPLRIPLDEFRSRGTGRVSVYARLRPGVTIEQAKERLSARMPGRTLPDGQRTATRVELTSRLDAEQTRSRTTVNVLTGAVAMILVIACVNVAGLLLARGASRQSELAVRGSLGAGRGRLVRQLLTESAVLAICGGVLGVFLAWLSLDAIVGFIPLAMPSNAPATLSPSVVGATAVLLIPTTLLFGLLPAIQLSRVRLGSVLARGGRQRGTALSRRGGQVLIAVEVALAVVLVSGAGLMIRSFMRLSATNLGFTRAGLLTLEVLPLDRSPAAHQEYYAALLQQVRTMPGVTAAGIVDNSSLGGVTSSSSISVAGKSQGTTVFEITPGYLEALGARVRAGRLLTEADAASGQRGVVISERTARMIFDGAAVGKQFARLGPDATPWTVVGVIADLRHGGPLATREEPQVFYPLLVTESDLNSAMMMVLRLSGPRPGMGDDLRRLAQNIGPRVLVERISTGDELFGERVSTPQRRTVLLSLLGGLGLALALVGVFGVTAYSVTRRTAEIGVRMAFGARPSQVVRAVVRDAAVPIVLGTIVGVGAAVLSTRAIQSFLFNTAPTDPLTLGTGAVTLAAAGFLAALVPAMRAAKIDPATSLRAQ